MVGKRLAILLCVSTFLLLLLGGVVHTTGSSLACPDWPACYGSYFPPMTGGILYEHGHRMLGSVVGLITLLLAGWTFMQPPLRGLRPYALLGVVLVVVQGTLGGLTVIYLLPPAVSTAHFSCAMAFFGGSLLLATRLHLGATPNPAVALAPARQAVAWTAGLVYLQLVLGAAVRHQKASMMCGYDALKCAGNWMPQSELQVLQSVHRLSALGVLAAVVWSTRKVLAQARRLQRPELRTLSLASHALVFLQILMGVWVIKSGVQLHVVTTHLGLGALLWGDLVVLWYMLRA